MKNKVYSIFFLLVFATIVSCSTQKSSMLNRNFHALTTKYNVLFNGKEAFKEGLKEIQTKYKDNYWEVLPIEPIKFDEDKVVFESLRTTPGPGNGFGKTEEDENKPLTPFEKAEEKAVKAIQKHSMNIRGREYNRQIDDAYLLLGKARYYTQRFVPAIEAFNYIIANYPDASLINETKIWRAKANIRNDNEELAIETLKILLNNEAELSDEIKESSHTALAMAYVKSDSIQRVIEHLNKATLTHKNREQTSRNLFVLGQYYSLQNKRDSASMVFSKLADFRKAPYKYRVHANIELAKNSTSDSSSIALINKYKKMLRNDDNRKYKDALYYQIGVLEENQDSIKSAIINYENSLKDKNGSEIQKTFTFERLGNIYFNKADFLTASSYYDSVLQVAKKDTDLRIRRIKRKHKNLQSLIDNEALVVKNDSILRIVAMTKEQQKTYFEDYIAKIKKEDEEKAQQQLNAISFGNSFGGGSAQSTTNQGKWYFYNTQALSFGEAEFQKTWGTRPLEDNWRWSEKQSTAVATKDSTQVKQNLKRYELATYLKDIPTSKQDISNLKFARQEALFQLGLIYKEQFKNNQLAISILENLLASNPQEKYILPANYHLYLLHKDVDNSKAEIYKNKILKDYSDTVYAQIILNPNKEIQKEEATSELETKYKEIYYLYKENKFEDVINEIDKVIYNDNKSILIPKFELLKAFAIGKYQDKSSYKKALQLVAIRYAGTDEGEKAKEIVKQLK